MKEITRLQALGYDIAIGSASVSLIGAMPAPDEALSLCAELNRQMKECPEYFSLQVDAWRKAKLSKAPSAKFPIKMTFRPDGLQVIARSLYTTDYQGVDNWEFLGDNSLSVLFASSGDLALTLWAQKALFGKDTNDG